MKNTIKNNPETRNKIKAHLPKPRSTWDRGINEYVKDFLIFLEEIEGEQPKITETILLNGASNWNEYSWGGCSLIYNGDIANRLCNPTELKKTKDGQKRPNHDKDWLDIQEKALNQAAALLMKTAAEVTQ